RLERWIAPREPERYIAFDRSRAPVAAKLLPRNERFYGPQKARVNRGACASATGQQGAGAPRRSRTAPPRSWRSPSGKLHTHTPLPARSLLGLLAKQVLLNLSAPRHRKGVHEEDAARDLEASDAISQAAEHV